MRRIRCRSSEFSTMFWVNRPKVSSPVISRVGSTAPRYGRSRCSLPETKPSPISAADSSDRNRVARPTDSATVAPREVWSTKCSVVRAVSSPCSRASSSTPTSFRSPSRYGAGPGPMVGTG